MIIIKKETKSGIKYSACVVTEEVEEVSKKLNEAQKIIGRILGNKSKTEISLRGGWCEELSGEFSIGHVTDQDLA